MSSDHTTAHLLRASESTQFRMFLPLATKTPEGCANCLMRTAEWNDGGYCHFWKEHPPELCIHHEPNTRETP